MKVGNSFRRRSKEVNTGEGGVNLRGWEEGMYMGFPGKWREERRNLGMVMVMGKEEDKRKLGVG